MTINPVVHPFKQDLGLEFDELKKYIGGKGAGLNKMSQLGVPVPPGFTIPTIFCETYQKKNKPTIRMKRVIVEAIQQLEQELNRTFGGGNGQFPLLVSVRSGAPVSMPGMMDTVLNLGLNAKTVEILARHTSEVFALDSYRRFIQMYDNVILGGANTAEIAGKVKAYESLFVGASDTIKLIGLRKLVDYLVKTVPVPEDPYEQLFAAIMSVFKSWNTDRAVEYRKIEGIPDDMGTAVNIQAMVYGNLNNQSGTGILFTFNPSSGDRHPYGDFLINAQGEDVVSGQYKTLGLKEFVKWNANMHDELIDIAYEILEKEYRDMLDIEFTIENGRLYVLQVRVGKRTPNANVKINASLLDRGLITVKEMESRNKENPIIEPVTEGIEEDPFEGWELIGTGKPACPGIVEGPVVLNQATAKKLDNYILLREMTEPDDVPIMKPAVGIITLHGGVVSHAAVIARSWNKPCIVGISNARIFFEDYVMFPSLNKGAIQIDEGDIIKMDGGTGKVYIKAN